MPSVSAKINFLLGCEHRTDRDEKLIQYVRKNKFDTTFLALTENSKGIKEPVALFRTCNNFA
jgi:hypothetical protein